MQTQKHTYADTKTHWYKLTHVDKETCRHSLMQRDTGIHVLGVKKQSTVLIITNFLLDPQITFKFW